MFPSFLRGKQKNWEDLSLSTVSLVYVMDEKELEEIGILKPWIKNAYALSSLSCLEKERVFVLEVIDEKKEESESVLMDYMEKLRRQEKEEWLLHPIIFQKDSFLVVVASPNAHTIMKEIKRFLGYEENKEGHS